MRIHNKSELRAMYLLLAEWYAYRDALYQKLIEELGMTPKAAERTLRWTDDFINDINFSIREFWMFGISS